MHAHLLFLSLSVYACVCLHSCTWYSYCLIDGSLTYTFRPHAISLPVCCFCLPVSFSSLSVAQNLETLLAITMPASCPPAYHSLPTHTSLLFHHLPSCLNELAKSRPSRHPCHPLGPFQQGCNAQMTRTV